MVDGANPTVIDARTPPAKAAAPQAPAVPAQSAAERLLERRLAIVARLDTRPLFEELANLDTRLDELQRARLSIEDSLVHAKASLEDAELMAGMNVEGKNETERRTAKAKAISDDLLCRECNVEVRTYTQRDAELEIEIDSSRRKIKRLEMKIQNSTAYLLCLAG